MGTVSHCQPELAEPLVPELLPYSLSVSFRLIIPGHSARIVSLKDVTSAFTQHSISWINAKGTNRAPDVSMRMSSQVHTTKAVFNNAAPQSCFGAFLVQETLTAWTELHSRLVSRYRSARFSSSLNLPSACQSKASPEMNNSQILGHIIMTLQKCAVIDCSYT